MSKLKLIVASVVLSLTAISGLSQAQPKEPLRGRCLESHAVAYPCGSNADGTTMICVDVVCDRWEFGVAVRSEEGQDQSE